MPPTAPYESTPATPGNLSPQDELQSLLTSSGIVPLTETGWIKVTGSDRVRWLNGMVTNSVQDLPPGHGCYNFLLSAQGRIQGDATIFAEPDHLLLETAAAQIPTLLALLDRFIIMDDVELADITSERKGLLLAGPHSPRLLSSLSLLPPEGPAPSLANLLWHDYPLTVVRAYSPLTPRFELWATEPTFPALSTKLHTLGAAPCTPAALNNLRILEGTPLFGTDIRDRDLPQETGANRALHFSKGCYLGQEIVERIRSRGQVHRTFGGFTLTGDPASPGAPLTVEGKPAGELTSTALLQTPAGEIQLALGYIRREFLVGSRNIQYPGGTAHTALLPFNVPTILGAPTLI